jgi:hypothetical protein
MNWIKLPSGIYLNLALVTDVRPISDGKVIVFQALVTGGGIDGEFEHKQMSEMFAGDDADEIIRALGRLVVREVFR